MIRLHDLGALLAVLNVARGAQAPFSVFNDILAFPQYDINFSESYILEADARRVLAEQERRHLYPVDDISSSQDVQAQQPMGLPHAEPQSNDQYERMMFEDIPYLCTIPEIGSADAENITKTEEEQQKELARASNQGWELLQGMQGECLYYSAQWWVYSFCFNQGIKQFHPLPPGSGGVPLFPPREDPKIASYTLGRFEKAIRADEASQESDLAETTMDLLKQEGSAKQESTPQLQTRGETNILVQTLGGGTICDLTGQPRRVEVQFHCNPSTSDKINMIKETASCVYLMVIHTPRLCNDVAFLPQQTEKATPITCQEIVAEEDIEEWTAWKTESTKNAIQELQAEAEALLTTPKPPLVIGGVVVGAQSLVGGTPERTIKASNIVTKPRSKNSKLIALLAKSDGKTVKVMSDAEFDKLDIKSIKHEVETYLAQSKNIRTGSPWKLELYGTDRGWELVLTPGADDAEIKSDDEQVVKSKEDDKPNTEGSEEEYK